MVSDRLLQALMHNHSNDTKLDLGTVLSEHHVTRIHLWVVAYMILGALTPTVWLAVEQARAFARQVPLDKVGLRVGLAVFGAAFAFWRVREHLHQPWRGALVRVCEQGLHLQGRDRSQSWRWTEIRRARVETAQQSVRTLTLETAVGEQCLPEGLSDMWELVNAFRRHGLIDEAALPRSWQSHRP
jgi:hypothetical protein